MGSRNLDRISAPEWRRSVETAVEMMHRRWLVTTRCRRCQLELIVDLMVVCRLGPKGPLTSLWNRRVRCRKLGCSGVADFYARISPNQAAILLQASDEHQGHRSGWGLGRPPAKTP